MTSRAKNPRFEREFHPAARPGLGPGRPRTTSVSDLQEAAFELFALRGYQATTVDQIARAAGVSRGTFFNYFPAKSDVFWVEVDASIARLRAAIVDSSAPADAAPPGQPVTPTDTDPVALIDTALLMISAEYGPDRVPWLLTQYRLLGDAPEVQASALSRVGILIDTMVGALKRGPQRSPLAARTIAFATVGAVLSAALAWAESGTGRGPLQPYLSAALEVARAGDDRNRYRETSHPGAPGVAESAVKGPRLGSPREEA